MNFIHFLNSLSWQVGSIVVVGLFIAFAVIGLLITRKIFDHKILKIHNDVAGYVFANLGVLYSVLLGFTVVNVQARFDKVKEMTQIEASYVSELYRDSKVFAEKDREAIAQALKAYIESVVTKEWPMMTQGIPNKDTIDSLHHIWNVYYAITPADKKQEIWYSISIDKLNSLVSSRLARILGSQESLGTEMWTMLISLGIIIIAFMWLFGLDNHRVHIGMIATLAATTAFLLFLIYSLDTIFSGDLAVPPDAFARVINTFKQT